MSITYREWEEMPAMLRADVLLVIEGLAEWEKREMERASRKRP